MKTILLLHLPVCLLGYLLLLLVSTPNDATSYLIGSGLIQANFWLLWVGWSLIFKKKLVALSVAIIVFKYAILGVIIYRLLRQPWLSPLWFAIGIASFAIAAVIYAFLEGLKKEEE